MSRLDIQRQQELEPLRMAGCKKALEDMGFEVREVGSTQLQFIFKGNKISFYPYSGWHSGKGIIDGRGFHKLVRQLK